jgi:hypothetical protein
MDRFTLEEQVMQCWGVTDDIDTLTEGVIEHDLTKDQISNILIGMKDLYQIRFETLQHTMETLISEGTLS